MTGEFCRGLSYLDDTAGECCNVFEAPKGGGDIRVRHSSYVLCDTGGEYR